MVDLVAADMLVPWSESVRKLQRTIGIDLKLTAEAQGSPRGEEYSGDHVHSRQFLGNQS